MSAYVRSNRLARMHFAKCAPPKNRKPVGCWWFDATWRSGSAYFAVRGNYSGGAR